MLVPPFILLLVGSPASRQSSAAVISERFSGRPICTLADSGKRGKWLLKLVYLHAWLHHVQKKGATLFFAITLPNPNRSLKLFYRHTQQ